MAKNSGRNIFCATVLVSAMLPICFFSTEPASAASVWAVVRPTQATEYPYYVEFRVAVDGVYGHSYIAYGRLDAFGRPATANYADIHPTGDLPSMVLGHFLPMEAATVPEKDTLGYKIASRFLKPLTAAEYGKLKLVITHIRAARHSWSVVAYNCNDFVADVARGMGMQTPATLSLPYDFIPRLQAVNQHRFVQHLYRRPSPSRKLANQVLPQDHLLISATVISQANFLWHLADVTEHSENVRP